MEYEDPSLEEMVRRLRNSFRSRKPLSKEWRVVQLVFFSWWFSLVEVHFRIVCFSLLFYSPPSQCSLIVFFVSFLLFYFIVYFHSDVEK